MRLIYFTESYPYGIGQEWKKNELNVLKEYFDEIIVVPFKYQSNKIPQPAIQGIKYSLPISSFFQYKQKSLLSLLSIFSSNRIFIYLEEFFIHKVYLSISKLKQWYYSTYLIENLVRNPILFDLLINSHVPTIAYFFWGRNTSEIITVLKNPIIKSCIRLHRYDLYDYTYSTNYIPYQKSQLLNSNLIISVSNDGKEYLQKKYSTFQSKINIKVLRLGTLDEGLSKESDDTTLRIISCSFIKKVKRVTLIAEALSYIFDVNIIWTHIGDGPEKESVINYISSFPQNIQCNIIGWVDPPDVKAFYVGNKVDLFINVSLSEGIPVSIMEAMSASIPVLATNVGGTKEIVNNNNGKLLPKDINPEMLSLEILNFYNLSKNAKFTMRTNAFESYKNNYNAVKNSHLLGHELLSLRDCNG